MKAVDPLDIERHEFYKSEMVRLESLNPGLSRLTYHIMAMLNTASKYRQGY